MMILILVVDVM